MDLDLDKFSFENPTLKDDVKVALKNLYDYAKSSEGKKIPTGAYNKLVVKNMTIDQIWEELQLQNNILLGYLESEVSEFDKRQSFYAATITQEIDKILQARGHSNSSKKSSKSAKRRKPAESDSEDEDEGEESENDSDEQDKDSDESELDSQDSNPDSNSDDFDGIDEAGQFEEDATFGRMNAQERAKQAEHRVMFGDDEMAVDDQQDADFFSYKSMEKFLEMGERDVPFDVDELDEEEANLELYGDGETEGDGKVDVHYDDWFAPKGKERYEEVPTDDDEDIVDDDDYLNDQIHDLENQLLQGENDFGVENGDDSDIDGAGNLVFEQETNEKPRKRPSKFEIHEERNAGRIKHMEDELIAKKSWQLSGETRSGARPSNALLEEDLEFDANAKMAPAITQDYTQRIEEMIKFRILERAFDDPVRKLAVDVEKRKQEREKAKQEIELDDKKSKKSLGEIYEEEWKKKQSELNPEEFTELDLNYSKCSELFKEVCVRLDALCNLVAAPQRRTKDEIFKPDEITSKNGEKKAVSTISIEEKIPFHVSDATRLAPEEIYERTAPALKKSKEEMLQGDRKKERKTRKAAKKRKNDEIEKKLAAREKENPMDMSKERAIKKIKQAGEKNVTFVNTNNNSENTKYSSSSQFFNKMEQSKSVDLVKEKQRKEKLFQKQSNNPNNYKL